MKKVKKGFTLVELMIVVAIIGILAAIAIPNFLRYQLRTKASERRINLEAIFKAEESLRQSERVVAVGAQPGQYLAFANAIPTGTVTVSKLPWTANDLQMAQQIDWMVQGNTYGKYNVATNSAAPFVAVAMCAWTDIDGDTSVYGADAMWNPQVATDGTEQTAPPAAPCDAKADVAVHSLTYTHNTDGMGRPTQLSADNVF